MDWYIGALKKYAVFSGRARRKEYWFFCLFSILISIALVFVDKITGTFNPHSGMGLSGAIYALAVLIPSLAVTFRRLHDTNRSGWWLLILLIPIIGAIVFVVLLATAGDPGDNLYGPSPKAGLDGNKPIA